MEYYPDKGLLIREMLDADAKYFATEEQKQGWHTEAEKFLCRFEDM